METKGKIEGLTDDVLQSSLTVLVYFALFGFALWYFFRGRLGKVFFYGFGVGAFYLFTVTALNNRKDKTYGGGLSGYAASDSNAGTGLIRGNADILKSFLP